MKNVKYVKVTITKVPVENYIESFKEVFVIDGEHFEYCDSIEEIRDMILNEYPDDIEFIVIETFKNKKDLEKEKIYELIAQ